MNTESNKRILALDKAIFEAIDFTAGPGYLESEIIQALLEVLIDFMAQHCAEVHAGNTDCQEEMLTTAAELLKASTAECLEWIQAGRPPYARSKH